MRVIYDDTYKNWPGVGRVSNRYKKTIADAGINIEISERTSTTIIKNFKSLFDRSVYFCPAQYPNIFIPFGRLIFVVHDLIFLDQKELSKITKFILGIWLKLAIYRASKIICITKTTQQKLLQHSAFAKQKTILVYNDVTDLTSNIESYIHKNSQFKFAKSDTLNCLFIGPLKYHKGCDILLRWITDMQEGGIKLRVVHIGPKNYRLKDGMEVFDNFISTGLIRQIGEVSDEVKYEELLKCDVVLCPSREEGYGLVPMEAIAFKRLVVYNPDTPVFDELYSKIGTDWNDFAASGFDSNISPDVSEYEAFWKDVEQKNLQSRDRLINALTNK